MNGVYFDRTRGVRHPAPGSARVYILEFEGNVVKVGQTRDFDRRVVSNHSHANAAGRPLLRYWHVETFALLEDEQRLLAMVRDLGGTKADVGREWFTEVDVDALIARADIELGRRMVPA